MRTALIIVLSLLLSNASQSQTSRRTDASNQALASPQEWGSITLRLFKDSDKKITFSFATSWIPGDTHQGLFRYRIKGIPVELTTDQRALEMNIPEAIERLVIRAHECSFELQLYDSDGFILRKVPIPALNYISADGRIVALSANEAVQMDASEYHRLIGTPGSSGSWDLGWGCGEIR